MITKKQEKPKRKRFSFLPSGLKKNKHDPSEKSCRVLHKNPSQRTKQKNKNYSRRGSPVLSASRSKDTRLFKHLQKETQTFTEEEKEIEIDKKLLKVGLRSQRSKDSRRVTKRSCQTATLKKKIRYSSLTEHRKASTLQRVFSLRLKPRTDSKTEKIDISSLVRMVHFDNAESRLISDDMVHLHKLKHETDILGARNKRSKLQRMHNLKSSFLEASFLSPTCGDMYGVDEDGSLSSSHDNDKIFKAVHVTKDRVSKVVTAESSENSELVNNEPESEQCEGIMHRGTDVNASSENKNNTLLAPQETYSNLTFHLSESEKSNRIKGSIFDTQSFHNVKQENVVYDNNGALPLKKRLSSNNCDIIIDTFEDPWVLKSDFEKSNKLAHSLNVSSKDNTPMYESIGFSVNTPGTDNSLLSPKTAKRKPATGLKRTSSIGSLDSFNSSIHSVNSEECMFSSDSEVEIDDDQVSVSSTDSFASAKDYIDEKDEKNDIIEKIRRSSSLDSIPNVSSTVDGEEKPLEGFTALDSMPIATPLKSTFSVDDVHRIIQRPRTLSVNKGYSLESTPKSDRKKEKNKRRSLDSSFKTVEIQSDFRTELEKHKQKSASSDSGLSNVLSPVLETGDVQLRNHDDFDTSVDKMYYTLPNPRKVKSFPPPLPKRKTTRIGSLSKMLSEKAESLSGLKLGTSFKLRNLEKPITSGLNKTKSLTNLMTKKGSAVVSSISTLIKGKSTSETNLDVVDSPFKPKSRKPARDKKEESVFVYEKVKVLIPRKRPANAQELMAKRKKLTLDLKLSNIRQAGSDSEYLKDIAGKVNLRKKGSLPSQQSSSSINSLRSPTLLDEVMKSVDTRRFSTVYALDVENESEIELDETSSISSSSVPLNKDKSAISDIITPGSVFINSADYFSICVKCKKMEDGFQREPDLCGRLANNEKRAQSLFNLNSCCTCSNIGNTYNTSASVKKHILHSDPSYECFENENYMVCSTPLTKECTFSSLQELRKLNNLPFQRYCLDDPIESPRTYNVTDSFLNDYNSTVKRKSSIKTRRSLPYSLMKCEPCLDLSADDLDEIGSIDENTEMSYQRNSEKSHSCSDLLDKPDETSLIESVICSDKPLERKPSKRGDRPIKVKSLSSSHDALTCLATVDIPFADELKKDVKNLETDMQNSTSEFTLISHNEGKEGEESSDSGNEDYHSFESEAEKVDSPNQDIIKIEETSQLFKCDTHSDFISLKSQCEKLSNSYPNIEAICENCNSKRNRKDHVETAGRYDLNSNVTLSQVRNQQPVCKQSVCSECSRLRTKDLLKPSKQESRCLIVPRKCLSVSDINVNDCNENKFNVCMHKSLSVLKSDQCSSKSSNYNFINSKHGKDTQSLIFGNSRIPITSKSTKFLFDDHHIETYKITDHLGHESRIKSVSSDDINHYSPLNPNICPKSLSALSLSKAQNEMTKYNHDNKLYIDNDFFPPHLSPLNRIFQLPPFQGFSAFSPPPADGQVPELEEVFKYDVCLGYLLHSITCDNKTICVYSLQRNKQLMEGVITPISGLPGAPHTRPSESCHGNKQKTQQKNKLDDLPNPAAPITVVPSEKLSHAGHVLRTVLLSRASHMIRDRKFHLRTYRRCMVGTEMVDWLLQQSSLVHSRTQAVGMWQALVEEGVVVHVCHEHQFKDKYLFYRFREDDQGVSTVPSSVSKKECEDDLQEVFLMLAQIGPDAMMRMILRKVPHERTVEDLEIIYEELLHIKALSHLSTMVKRELASVLVFESHAKSGTVLFNQGDEGKSWYIILKGSVNVVIYGKGVVCTLHEGDDFGKLALVNDAPRAATIVLRDDNCHFLRVDKDDFNRILRDVEANTVRLKEHGQDVLVLEKIPTNTQSADGTVQAHYKYSIMAGTPEKMLEHLLETRLDNKGEEELGMYRDGFLEDFLLTHVIFMPCNHLCPVLLSHYHSSMSDSSEQENFEFMLNHKKCVLHFVQEWAVIVGNAFREDHTINAFLEELHSCLLEDQQSYTSLRDDVDLLENIIETQGRLAVNQLLTNSGTQATLSRKSSKEVPDDAIKRNKIIKAADENIFKVYCADHTYCTLRLPMDTSVEQILSSARDKLCLGDDLVLCEVKSTGERITFKEMDLCVTSGLSINGRLFITPREHLDALTPLPEQDGPPQGSVNTIELVSSREMAYYMTVYDWDLFSCVQEYELIYQVFGRYKFHKITANLDLFLRRFNEIQFWVVTEMVLTSNLSKRVALLRKFIKLASHCKDYQNLNSFFAIVMGLSNIAVSRLSQTWEKLPGKFKKMFADFETLMDPSRNHRVYRLSVAKMVPPIIPFMPLLMKDMTFTHEGNKTYFDGLVNFEKMHMIAQTLKTVRFCRSSTLELEAPSSLKSADISNYIKNLQVIDNQRHLTQLSHKLEPRKT